MHRSAIIAYIAPVCMILAFAPACLGQTSPSGSRVGPLTSFEDMRQHVEKLPAGDPSITGLIATWLEGKRIEGLGIDELQWCIEHLLSSVSDRTAFTAIWNGFIVPPRDGAYVFSTTPININKQSAADHVRHTIKIVVAAQTQVDAGAPEAAVSQPADLPPLPDRDRLRIGWIWSGAPIELKAKQPVAVRVEVTYSAAKPALISTPSAILCWEGPGIGRMVVPQEVITSSSKDAGLQVTYQLGNPSRPAKVIGTSPNVDFVWTTAASVAPTNPELVKKLSNRLWELSTANKYISQCIAGRSTHPYLESDLCLSCLSSLQRAEFTNTLLGNRQMLYGLNADQLTRLYGMLRFGSDDKAIDLVGVWMQQHADIAPTIAADFFKANRRPFWELGQMLSQVPNGKERLRDRYLTMDNGHCSLPVAYTLTYATSALSSMRLPELELSPDNLTKNELQEWTDYLDDRIADKSLARNRRVNWLIARAQAESVLRGNDRAVRSASSSTELNWLSAAEADADDAGTVTRLHLEYVSRLVASNQRRSIAARIELAAEVAPAETIVSWQLKVDAIAKAREERLNEIRSSSRHTYRQALKERLEIARKNDDTEASQRYNRLLPESYKSATSR